MKIIKIIKDIADSMAGIGGIPNNKEFYDEFNFRVKAALGLQAECEFCNDKYRVQQHNLCERCRKLLGD